MEQAGERRLDHVVLPRRRPGLALLERYFPSPAPNVVDAELAAFAAAGDTVLDPWAGTGWTARRALQRSMRAVASEPSPFAQLAAQALLRAPDPATLDAAFTQLAMSRRVDVPLAQHIQELYATRCGTCRRPVVADQFIWPRGAPVPARKTYGCSNCSAAVGGPEERSAEVDAIDLAKLGIELSGGGAEPRLDLLGPSRAGAADDDEELPPAPTGLTGPVDAIDEADRPSAGAGADGPAAGNAPPSPDRLGEPGGPPAPRQVRPPERAFSATPMPRYSSTVEPARFGRSPADVRLGLHYESLRERFPVLDGREDLVDELLGLYTPRNLYALQTIAAKIDAEFRDGPMNAFMRLALASCLLPASRLNGYPGRVASLRITNGHVREPSSRHHREVNVWALFESAFRDVKMAVAALGRDLRPARFAADFGELGGMSANVLWIRCRPAVVGQYLPPESVDFVIGSPASPPNVDELSFEYLATAWVMGREAAETLRLEPLFAPSAPRSSGTDATALRHAIGSAATALKPGGWFTVLLEGDDADRMLGVALAGAASGLDVVDVIPRESMRSGDGFAVHMRRPSAEDRLRAAVHPPRPLTLGAQGGHLTYVELAAAIERASVALLTARGEPARYGRLVAAVIEDLARSGLLRRVAQVRGGGSGGVPSSESPADAGVDDADAEVRDLRIERAGPAILATLISEELWRDDHPRLVRIGESDRPVWWLRNPELTEQPLADRVEWATFSLLSTGGGLDESRTVERIMSMFPGAQSPDEELVVACVAAYARPDAHGRLRTDEDVQVRFEDHARMIRLVADYGHRLRLRVWISRAEQRRTVDGMRLGDRLADDERRAYLPLIVKGASDALGEVDAIWYVRGRMAFLIEVEWTAMLGDAILKRGRAIEPSEQQVRFLVFPAERTDLLRLKIARSPWLRDEIERQNWHFLKWQHLEALAGREIARLESLENVLGLDPLIERGGEQLKMFGE